MCIRDRYLGMEVPRKEKGKIIGHSRQRIVMFPEGDPMRLQLPGPGTTISSLDGTKDVKAISTIVPLLQIVKHETLDGTQEALPVPRILAKGDRRIDLSKEDVMCVGDRVVTPFTIRMNILHLTHHLRQYLTENLNQSCLNM